MASKQLVTVFGATGKQGGSLIEAILDHAQASTKYSVRAVTRDPSSGAGQKLRARGVEVVGADLSQANSLVSVVKGSHAVFGVTNFWELKSAQAEETQGRNLVDACVAAGVQHLLWSGLPDATKVSNGALKQVVHFDSKANVADYLEKNKGRMWSTVIQLAYYMPNYKQTFRQIDGRWTWSTILEPNSWIPSVDTSRETGAYVLGALMAGEAANGATLHAVSDWNTVDDTRAAFREVTGVDLVLLQQSRQEYKQNLASVMGDEIAEELTQTIELVRDFEYYGRDARAKQAESDRFLPSIHKKSTLRTFIKNNGPWFEGK